MRFSLFPELNASTCSRSRGVVRGFQRALAISMYFNFMIYKVFNYDLQRSTKILRKYPKWIRGKAPEREGRREEGRAGRAD